MHVGKRIRLQIVPAAGFSGIREEPSEFGRTHVREDGTGFFCMRSQALVVLAVLDHRRALVCCVTVEY